MASDEELAQHVARLEGDGRGGLGEAGAPSLAEYKAYASEIHDELARRIERVDDRAVDAAALEDLEERLERLESRLEALETPG